MYKTTFFPNKKISLSIFLVAIIVSLFSCVDEIEVKDSILPNYNYSKFDSAFVLCKTVRDPGYDYGGNVVFTVGMVDEGEFGKTKASIVSTLIPTTMLSKLEGDSSVTQIFGTNPVLESAMIYLRVDTNLLNVQDRYSFEDIKIYQVNEFLDKESYSTNDVISFDKNSEIATFESLGFYNGDTNAVVLKFTVNPTVAESLFSTSDNDSMYWIHDSIDFHRKFNGIYITTADNAASMDSVIAVNVTGSELALEFTNTDIDSVMEMHYAFKLPNTNAFADLIKYRNYDYNINLFEHDFTGTPVETAINDGFASNKFYLKSYSGCAGIVDMSPLNKWLDSTDVIINYAELSFRVDTNFEGFDIPVLRMNAQIYEDGELANILDAEYQDFSSLPGNNGIYEINITKYFRNTLDNQDGFKSIILRFGSGYNLNPDLMARFLNDVEVEIYYTDIK